VDVGGVLTKSRREAAWEDKIGHAAPGALEGLRRLVQLFGDENVFLVSKVHLGGGMQHRTERWLHDTCMVCERTGLKSGNIRFCENTTGSDGKGVVAKELQLSHFVDDRLEVLESVFADPCGNSGDCVRAKRGKLFHFVRGTLPDPADLDSDMRPFYTSVAAWPQLLSYFSCPIRDEGKCKVSRELLHSALAAIASEPA